MSPLLGFQAQFADVVESGEKTQTIRAYRKDKRDPKPGDTLYLYTGLRTKQCRKLGEAIAESVEVIGIGEAMFCEDESPIEIVPLVLLPREAHDLAIRDGFSDLDEMLSFFDKTHDLPFEGLLIRWGELESGGE